MKRMLFCAMLLGLAAAASAAENSYDRGQQAMAAGAYVTAASDFRDFINGNVGDPRIKSARDLMYQARLAEAELLEKAHLPCQSAQCLLDYADDAGDDPRAAQSRGQAKANLQAAFTQALAWKNYDLAAEIADTYDKAFPNDKPLADDETLRGLKIDGLGVLSHQTFSIEPCYQRFNELLKEGMTTQEMQARKVDPFKICFDYATLLYNRGWYSQAEAVAQPAGSLATEDADHKRCAQLLADAAVARANAEARFGNVQRVADAVADLEKFAPDAARTAEFRNMKSVAAQQLAGPAGKPHQLPANGPILGNANWIDDGSGYTCDKQVQIGDRRSSPTITVHPGFLLQDVTMEVQHGELVLAGDPLRPVIFRHVQMSCEFGGHVTARNAIFEDCTFSKGGAWFSYFSSTWSLTSCLLLRSGFSGLGGTDYGINLTGCAFVDCTFPDRQLWDAQSRDISTRLYSDWNTIAGCDFLGCDMMPSAVWTTRQGNFQGCHVIGTDTYQADSNISALIYVGPTDRDFWAGMVTGVESLSRGKVRISMAAQPFARRGQLTLWPWLGTRENTDSGN